MNWDYKMRVDAKYVTKIECDYKRHEVKYDVPTRTIEMVLPYCSYGDNGEWENEEYVLICNECIKEFVTDLLLKNSINY